MSAEVSGSLLDHPWFAIPDFVLATCPCRRNSKIASENDANLTQGLVS